MYISHPIQILMPPFLEASPAVSGGVYRNFSSDGLRMWLTDLDKSYVAGQAQFWMPEDVCCTSACQEDLAPVQR
jgi:hypothetical protein